MRNILSLKHILAFALSLYLATSFGAAQDDKDPIVAVVNGQSLTESMFRIFAQRLSVPDHYLENMPREIYFQILDRLISHESLVQQAEAAGMRDDPEVKKNIETLMAGLIHDSYLLREIEKEITDEALQKAYKEYTESFASSSEVKARHILLETKEQAQEVIKALKDGGDFAALAKEKSTGPSGPHGGDLGWFTKDRMVPEFSKAAFALEKGKYTEEPVKTQFGYHVILSEDKKDSQPDSFEKARPEIHQKLQATIATRIINAARVEAQVEIYDQQGNLIDNFPTN